MFNVEFVLQQLKYSTVEFVWTVSLHKYFFVWSGNTLSNTIS